MNFDQWWPRASAWLEETGEKEEVCDLGVVGLPLHVASLSEGRCDEAPQTLRRTLQHLSVYDLEYDRDVRTVSVRDFGDLPIASLTPEQALSPILASLPSMIKDSRQAVVVLGGDNSVTRPAFRALQCCSARSALLTLDAHLDMRHLDEGLNNGNPISALLEDGLPGSSVIQIGLQSFANSKEYFEWSQAAGVQTVNLSEVRQRGILTVVRDALNELSSRADYIYVDADLDVLDRSLSPGTPGSRPGGLTMSELRQALLSCGAHPKVRVVDLVEFDPSKDVAGITAYCAAIAMLSFVSGLVSRVRT